MKLLLNKKLTTLLVAISVLGFSSYASAQDEAPVFDEPSVSAGEPMLDGQGPHMRGRRDGEFRNMKPRFRNQGGEEDGEDGEFNRKMKQKFRNHGGEEDGEDGEFNRKMKQKFRNNDGKKGKEFIKKVVSELPPDVQSQCNACHQAIDEHIKSKIEERKESNQGNRAKKLGNFLEAQGVDMENLSDEELAKIKDVIKRRKNQQKEGFAKGKPEFARERDFAPEAPLSEGIENDSAPEKGQGKKGLFKRFF